MEATDVPVLSQPTLELVASAAKHVKNCKELVMSGRGITELAGLEEFVALEVLWLDGNRLRSLDGLGENFRLKELYAHGNEIATLRDAAILSATFLRVLALRDNRIAGLDSSLKVLKRFRHLEELDLHNNPVCEEANYRLHVIKRLPWLCVLDRHHITEEERRKAAGLEPPAPLSRVATERRGPKRRASTKEAHTAEQRAVAADVREYLDSVKATVSGKRILLRPHFLDRDPRREQRVTARVFFELLGLFGLAPGPQAVGARSGANLRRLILDTFGTAPPVRSRRLGRDRGPAGEAHVDYPSFCTATDPGATRRSRDFRDVAESALEGAAGWKCAVPKYSASIRALQRRRAADERAQRSRLERTRREREEQRRRSEALATESANTGAKMATSAADFAVATDQLSAWELTVLRKLLRDADTDESGFLRPSEIRGVVRRMEFFGRAPVLELPAAYDDDDDDDDDDNNNNEEFSVLGTTARASQGVGAAKEVPQDALDRVFLAAMPGGDGRVSWRDFVAIAENGARDIVEVTRDGGQRASEIARLRWRSITASEARTLAEDAFHQAKALDRASALSGDEASAAARVSEIHKLAARALRLQAIASRAEGAARRERGAAEPVASGATGSGVDYAKRKRAAALRGKFGVSGAAVRRHARTHGVR